MDDQSDCINLATSEAAAPATTPGADAPVGGPEEPPPPDPIAAAVREMDARIAAGVSQLLAEFRSKLLYDQSKQAQIDRLHAELQQYKSDAVAKAVRPLLLGLIRLHDDIGKLLQNLRARPESDLTPDRLLRHIAEVQDDIDLLLGQHGVDAFQNAGEEFDPHRQTALRTTPADDPSLVGQVADRLRPGFAQGDTLLQKERVAVYVTPKASADRGGEA